MCVYFTLLLIFLNWNGDRTYSLYKEGYSVVHTLFIVVYYTKQHFGEINKYSTTFKVRHFFCTHKFVSPRHLCHSLWHVIPLTHLAFTQSGC